MQTPTNLARKPSLIERAADAYQLAERINARVEREQAIVVGGGGGETLGQSAHPTPGRIAFIDRGELSDGGFILPDASPTALAEEFRIVKRQLLQSAMGGQGTEPVTNGRAVLISSAEPDEGKTFCAINLALSMAREREIEVLLVDADFAKPEILSTLGIAGGPGLVDALSDPAIDVESCVIRTDLPNLSVLPAGRALNETNELLASEAMRDICEKLTSNPSRIVIFDSSPALAASTGSVLAGLVGQVVVVVRADVTGESELRAALNLLSGCDHVRLLINAVQLQPRGRRFGAYYGYGG
ncbi:MAG: AAA family ATPase [Sphingomonadaceae bacterium]